MIFKADKAWITVNGERHEIKSGSITIGDPQVEKKEQPLIEKTSINDTHAKAVCKIGKGRECCRYLAAGSDGFCCLKWTEHKLTLDIRALNGDMTAQSDNCDGIKPFKVRERIK